MTKKETARANEYQQKAKEFLTATGTTLDIVECVPQKNPIWADKDEQHGINYSVTLKNKNHSYTFDFWGSIADREKLNLAREAKARGVYSSHYYAIKDWCAEQAQQTVPNIIKGAGANRSAHKEYTANAWLENVVETVKILITPTVYDILACLNPMTEDSFEDFCSSFGYETDSRKALKTYEACKEQDYQLRKLFSREEIEKLAEIN